MSTIRRLYPIVHVALTLAALLAIALYAPTVVFGQTATPTPPPTPTRFASPTPTATPVGTATPQPPAPSTSIHWCFLNPGHTAGTPASCFWGSSVSIIRSHYRLDDVSGTGSSGTGNAHVLLLPPADTKSLTLVCSSNLVAINGDFGTGSSSAGATQFYRNPAHLDVVRNGQVGLGQSNTAESFGSGPPQQFQVTLNVVDTIVWTLKSGVASWPGSISSIDEYNDSVSFPGFYVNAGAGTSGNGDNFGYGEAYSSCQVTSVERLDGSIWIPGDPGDPDPTPTATPCLPNLPCWVVIPTYPITPIGWDPIAVPTVATTVTFGIGPPQVVECYEVIPTTVQTVTTWFGDWQVGFDGVQTCVRERSLDIQLDEFDFGGWAVGLWSFMGVGVLWLMFRR